MDVHPGIYPYKARYQVVGVDVCVTSYKAFFIRCMFDPIGQSPHLLSLYYRLQRKQIQNLSNVFKFYLLSGRLSGIHGKTLCEEHGERK